MSLSVRSTVGATAAALAAAAILGPVAGAHALTSPGPLTPDVSSNVLLNHDGIVHGELHGLRTPPDVAADGWVVADADTGDILASKRANIEHPPASTLKVLTALAITHRLDAEARIAAPATVESIDGTRVGLVPRATYLTRDVITAMLIASGNDAAETLAAAAGGDATTLQAMRDEAHLLQATHTVPGTVSGLDAHGQHTTAYDLAIFGRAALNDAVIAPYLTIPHLILSSPGVKSFQIDSHNPLLGVYPGIIGVKAGYTTLAQATYIGAAKRGGHRILITLIDAAPKFKPAATALLDWGFAARDRVEPIGRLPGPLTASPLLTNTDAVATGATAARAHRSSLDSPVRRRVLDLVASLAAIAALMRLRVKMRRRRWQRAQTNPQGTQSPLGL